MTALNWLPKETKERVRVGNAVDTYGPRL
jgi:hypothetical protein